MRTNKLRDVATKPLASRACTRSTPLAVGAANRTVDLTPPPADLSRVFDFSIFHFAPKYLLPIKIIGKIACRKACGRAHITGRRSNVSAEVVAGGG